MVGDAAPVAAITTAELADRLDGHGLTVIDANEPVAAAQPSMSLPARQRTILRTSSTPQVPPVCPKVLRSLIAT